MPLATPSRLELPLTGQRLREAVARGDIRALLAAAAELRVAGYRVDPQRLANELLRHGCTTVNDAFGHPVLLEVHVPYADRRLQIDESASFRIAA